MPEVTPFLKAYSQPLSHDFIFEHDNHGIPRAWALQEEMAIEYRKRMEQLKKKAEEDAEYKRRMQHKQEEARKLLLEKQKLEKQAANEKAAPMSILTMLASNVNNEAGIPENPEAIDKGSQPLLANKPQTQQQVADKAVTQLNSIADLLLRRNLSPEED